LYVKYILPLCLDNIFKVTVQKTVQGLGLSVTGGVVSATPAPSGCFSPSSAALEACSWPGLIRIKKIFPHGAAWQTNKLAAGDVLLSANDCTETGQLKARIVDSATLFNDHCSCQFDSHS